jgi:hypothetical protein
MWKFFFIPNRINIFVDLLLEFDLPGSDQSLEICIFSTFQQQSQPQNKLTQVHRFSCKYFRLPNNIEHHVVRSTADGNNNKHVHPLYDLFITGSAPFANPNHAFSTLHLYRLWDSKVRHKLPKGNRDTAYKYPCPVKNSNPQPQCLVGHDIGIYKSAKLLHICNNFWMQCDMTYESRNSGAIRYGSCYATINTFLRQRIHTQKSC